MLPYLDECVFFDGGSTDGTVEILEAIIVEHPHGHRINIHRNRDCANLQDAYVELFNECLRTLTTDLAWFAHPDFYCVNPEQLLKIRESKATAMLTHMRSFAGEPGGDLYEIKGRGEQWKNIYRLRNPDFGAHYFGHYGAHEEDVYFSDITGEEHKNHAPFWDRYPYEIEDSGLEILHFSDVRHLSRRHDRMVKCLVNQGHPLDRAERIAKEHPRVTLKDAPGFAFIPSKYPGDFVNNQKKYSEHFKTPCSV